MSGNKSYFPFYDLIADCHDDIAGQAKIYSSDRGFDQ